MKKIIRIFFIISLVCFSFFYTDKVMNLLNSKDPLMVKLNNIKKDYEVLPVNAIIDNDTIVPGKKGLEVDIDKSYEEMKLGGIFREESLIYKDILPSSSISNNKDKYIVKGNSNNEVSLIVIYNPQTKQNITNISNITIYLNHKDITNTNIKKLKKQELYTYGNNGVYTKEILDNDNIIINKLSNNKSKYCLLKEKNSTYLNICNNNNMLVVIPSIIGGYNNIKNNLTGGSIILLEDTSNIDIIIKYINSKGYTIVPLSKLLTE